MRYIASMFTSAKRLLHTVTSHKAGWGLVCVGGMWGHWAFGAGAGVGARGDWVAVVRGHCSPSCIFRTHATYSLTSAKQVKGRPGLLW